MEENITDIIKDTELFMMAQFFDVMEALEQHENFDELKADIRRRKKMYVENIFEMAGSRDFFSLSLYDKSIDAKLEECSDIYSSSVEYKSTLKELEKCYESLEKKLDTKDREKLKDIKDLIYSLSDFDVHLAYKIGLVDGLKTKASKI